MRTSLADQKLLARFSKRALPDSCVLLGNISVVREEGQTPKGWPPCFQWPNVAKNCAVQFGQITADPPELAIYLLSARCTRDLIMTSDTYLTIKEDAHRAEEASADWRLVMDLAVSLYPLTFLCMKPSPYRCDAHTL